MNFDNPISVCLDRINPLFGPIKAVFLLFVLISAIPGAMGVLTLNAATPSEVDICNSSQFAVYANNTDPLAGNIAINVTIPEGFAYQAGSTRISYPINNISVEEPIISGQYLNWTNSTWLLGNGDSLKIQFNLKAGCAAPSGKRLLVFALYSGVSARPFSSPSIMVNQGLLKITKDPNVIEAGIWDRVNWTINIENQGTGPAYNVLVNDSPSSGLQLISLDSPGGGLNWSYPKIDPGEIKKVNASFKVINCSNLVNLVNTSSGCASNSCQETYAKGSIKFVPKEPDLDYTFDPSSIVVPYCNKTHVNVNITNIGTGNATAVHMVFSEFNAPYAITNVSGAEYIEENHTFILGSLIDWQCILAKSCKNISFDFAMPYQMCDRSGTSGVFNVNVRYYDDCGDEWFPPLYQVAYSMDPGSAPSISVSKSSNSGNNSLYLGETVNYTLTVDYQCGSSCPGSLPGNIIVDRFPQAFEVLDAAGGAIDQENHSIIWNDQDLNNTLPWSKIICLRARLQDNCSCGAVFNNELYVNASSDCCGCPLTANTTLPIIVKCFNESVLNSSGKIALPSLQENCRLIDYSNAYIFNNSSPLQWSDINFTEQGNNGQTFSDGGDFGNASFNLNGCINVSLITLNSSKSLAFLEDACGALQKGDVLWINYTLRQPNAGSFVDWSSLCVDGYNSGCAEMSCFQEATCVVVNQADYDIAILGVPSLISACRTFDLTINLSKNSPDDDPRWIARNLSITYNDSNYRYIGPASITGIVNQSGVVQSFEPESVGHDLSWKLGSEVS
ncbi:MAG: hypothetical protein JW999_06640, partial [Methanotrichaceae archaeon]|nr:hypothetical protein [Methanotrichaceae archaeon]